MYIKYITRSCSTNRSISPSLPLRLSAPQYNLLTDVEEVGWTIVEVVGPSQGVRPGHHLGGAAMVIRQAGKSES